MKFLATLLIILLLPTSSSAADDWKNIPFYSEGFEYRISDYDGKFKLVLFWATWCPHCKTQMTAYSLLKNAYKHRKNLEVLAISTDTEGEDQVKAFFDHHNISNLTSFMDNNSNLFKNMGFYAIPSMVLISPDNKILGIYSGLQDFDIEYLDKLLSKQR